MGITGLRQKSVVVGRITDTPLTWDAVVLFRSAASLPRAIDEGNRSYAPKHLKTKNCNTFPDFETERRHQAKKNGFDSSSNE